MIGKGELSSRGAKDTLAKLVESGGDANEIARTLGVIQTCDEGLIKIAVEKIIAENPKD
jgi:Asp-tRNA(Asn)/Glu-tRNA(Gln) amidotransferase B subunit